MNVALLLDAIMKKILLDIYGELLSHARMYVNNTPIHACLYVRNGRVRA